MSFSVKLSALPINYNNKAFIVGRDNIYTTTKARFSRSQHPLVSENANTCLMLGLNGGENSNCLMHLAPEQQPLGSLKAGLEKCLEKLRYNMGNISADITGILVGGRHSGNKESFNLLNEIIKIMDEFEIPFSMICGKFDGIANDNIIMSGDKTRIWNNSFKDLELPKNATQEEFAEILGKNYEVVDLVPEAPIIV